MKITFFRFEIRESIVSCDILRSPQLFSRCTIVYCDTSGETGALYSAMSLLPHAYHILFFMTIALEAALRMQILEEVSYLLFFFIITPTRLKHSQNDCAELGQTTFGQLLLADSVTYYY